MIVYHGSHSNFKKLRISPKLCKHASTVTNEGYGIYFSTTPTVALTYGKYIYTLEINDDYIIDYRKKSECRKLVNTIMLYIKQECDINIYPYFKDSLERIIDNLYLGGLGISSIGDELILMLDSSYEWYATVSNTKIQKVYRKLKSYNKTHMKAYLFNYHIKNIGIICDASDNVVKIIAKDWCYQFEERSKNENSKEIEDETV